MKKHAVFPVQWLFLRTLVILAILPLGTGLASDTYRSLSSQYSQALKLLKKTGNRTITGSEKCPAGNGDYLRKKLRYYRFLDAYIEAKKKELAAEGVSISVIGRDDLLFLKGYGYADKEVQRPATPLTLFGVGSVSKLFTGIAIMQLVEQKEIDLDAPLENYIPGFGYKTHFPNADPITVRALMTHQSGLVGDIIKGGVSIAEPENDFRELVELFKKEYLAYPPGYISSYSNSAVALLGIVIEEVSGMEFKTYIQKNICRPLGMLTANFSLRDYMVPMLAKSYDSAGGESPFLYLRDKPAGSFISNVLEMSLFMRMILNSGKLFGQQILKQSTLKQMFVHQNGHIELDFPNDHGEKWGLSWVLHHPSLAYAGKYIGHSGGIPHYYTQLHILPEHGLAVIVETNSETGAQLSEDVADMAMIKALEIFKGINYPNAPSLPPLTPLSQDHIVQLAGTYATNHMGMLSIYHNNNRLYADSTLFGEFELELKPHRDNWFSFYLNDQLASGFENLRITVKNSAKGRFIGIQYRDESGTVLSSPEGFEFEIPDELPLNWMNRVGQYSIINPDSYTDAHVLIQVLPPGVLSHGIGDDQYTVLDPIFEDQAVRTGLGRNINETIQVIDCNGEECLYHLGYVFQKQSELKTSSNNRSIISSFNLENKGREIEKKLIRRFHFPGRGR
jgi:CubicO group peptidase (beta-lactamase class C family)